MGARMGRLARRGNQSDVRQQLWRGICAYLAVLMVSLVGVLVRPQATDTVSHRRHANPARNLRT
eukprot:COSAG02_NODE_14469_length_1267_cov_350.688141_2_plen_64_part_00